MNHRNQVVCEEDQVWSLIDDWTRAICAEDVDRIMSHYAADAVVFDATPPFQVKSADVNRRNWEASLASLPGSLEIETQDLQIDVSGDLALAHWCYRFSRAGETHSSMRTWVRATVGLRKREGRWQIVHEHTSVPFDPQTLKAAVESNP